MLIQQQNTPQPAKLDEKILVVRRDAIVPTEAWHGLVSVDMQEQLAIVNTHKQFLWRSAMEEDPAYKQIIPYLIFQYQDRYFLMQRRSNASATALQNKYSLGIGGHIREEDMAGSSLFDWARREFYEEVNYSGSLHIEPLGIINDDSNQIGEVHLGFALLLVGDSDNISIRDEHKSGTLLTLGECQAFYDRMESWSQFIMQALTNKI